MSDQARTKTKRPLRTRRPAQARLPEAVLVHDLKNNLGAAVLRLQMLAPSLRAPERKQLDAALLAIRSMAEQLAQLAQLFGERHDGVVLKGTHRDRDEKKRTSPT